MTTTKIQIGAIATLLALAVLAGAQTSGTDKTEGALPERPVPRAAAVLSRVPLYFVENRGVYAEEVKYYIQGADKTLFFTKEGVTVRLTGADRAWVVKLEFVGANPLVRPEGQDRQQAVFSYFKGPEKDWKAGLPSFSKVVYRELWPGIDLVYSGTVNQLKYEFVVAPGADPSRIRLQYRGAERVSLKESGALRIETPEGGFESAPPYAYQEIEGERVEVEMQCALAETAGAGTHEFGFHVGKYDRTKPLVLDPAVLVYCGYIGGAGSDDCLRIAVDAAGNAYVAGQTAGPEQTFPVTVGPDLTYNAGSFDGFVAKVNLKGSRLLYCGYIGGSGWDFCAGIAVDGAGNAYVAGQTASTEQTFPVTVGPDLTHNGDRDGFVAKVNPDGTTLLYCGYIGGTGWDACFGIAVDGVGSAYVTGRADSKEQTFPVAVGPDLTHNGGIDVFVAKVNVAGTGLLYCGYIGGSSTEFARGIAVDGTGNLYVSGYTISTEQTFPVAVGPDLTHNGGTDVFVARVNPQGTGLVYCGYIGGSSGETSYAIALDGAGNAYVSGQTQSTEQTFPVAVGPDLTHNGGDDVFVAKVNATGTALVYCGYIGGSSSEFAWGAAVDSAGNAYVSGQTQSTEQTFPVTVGPDLTHNGGDDVFVAKVNTAGTALVYCGYIGGTSSEYRAVIAVDRAGNAYVTGQTESSEQSFPVRGGPNLTYNGSGDAFIAKVALTLLAQNGRPGIGSTVNLEITASDSAGLTYVMGSSLGNGPIPIDQRSIDLSQDDLLLVSASGYWPSIFQGYAGVIATTGTAAATIQIPNHTALVGLRIYTAFVTLSPAAPSGIQAISNTVDFTIEK